MNNNESFEPFVHKQEDIIKFNHQQYRNSKVRHSYEFETRVDIKNMNDKDEFDCRKIGVNYSRVQGATRDVLEGNKFKE